jgi:hypothetical protein
MHDVVTRMYVWSGCPVSCHPSCNYNQGTESMHVQATHELSENDGVATVTGSQLVYLRMSLAADQWGGVQNLVPLLIWM